jgi:hypothetical protein
MDVNGEDPDYDCSTRESENIEDPTENTTELKRKGTDNHTIRVNPRFSDLFSSPASGAPIIIQLVSEPCSFRLMNLTEKPHRRNHRHNRPSEAQNKVDTKR